MTLTAADVASLSRAMSHWEIGEYISTGAVAVACAGEGIAEITNWFTKGIRERKELLAKCSTLLLLAALSSEAMCLIRTNQLSGEIIGSINDLAEQAADNSTTAISQSGLATAKAVSAEGSSDAAISKATEASASASHSLALAGDVRRKAASLKKELEQEKQDTTAALQKEAAAEKSLDAATARAILPRIVEDPKEFESLEPFPKARAEILYKQDDGEAYLYASQLAQGLKSLGWDVPDPVPTRETPTREGGETDANPLVGTFLIVPPSPGVTWEFTTGCFPAMPNAEIGALMCITGASQLFVDPKVPEGTFKIVIGQRFPGL